MIDLGRYTATVLAAYGVSVALLVGLIWHSIAANTHARRNLEKHKPNA
jgi:heme exporter protein D